MTITPIQSTERAPVIAPATALQTAQPSSSNQDSTSATQDQSASGYYFSPVLKIDPQTQSVVIQYRNSQTGVVTNQYPSEKELKAYASKQKFSDLESEPSGKSNSQPAATASQPAPTATVDATAVKPASTFNTSTPAPAPTETAAPPLASAAAGTSAQTGNSIVI